MPLGVAASARDAVCRRLAEQAERFPDLAIEGPDTAGLSERDAALAHAIYDAAIRRWLTLSFLLEAAGSRPLETLEPRLRAVLLCGAAQLLLLDRIPVHAAVNESVEWAKQRIRRGAGGMANAVLRKVAALRGQGEPGRPPHRRAGWSDRRDEIPLPDGSAVALAGEVLPEDAAARLAVATSHPPALVARWRERFGPEAARDLALHSLVPAPVILNTAAARMPLPEPPLAAPHEVAGHHVFRGTRHQLVALLSSRDDVWVQDPASSRAVAMAGALRPRLVVDLCAGQGTKTRQLVHAFPEARVIATDADAGRARTLTGVFRDHERVRVIDLAEVHAQWAGRVDLVLVDVPCSNTGVLARRAEAKYRADEAALARLVEIQRQIITDAAALLAPGGHVLYSTCSLEAEENEQQAAWASERFGLAIVASAAHRPRGRPGEEPESYTDGSYAALLGPRPPGEPA